MKNQFQKLNERQDLRVHISDGNSKMGRIPSVSLPPIVTCANQCECAKKCYAVKLCRLYKNVKQSYAENLKAYISDPEFYFDELNRALRFTSFFRMHVSGDIPDPDYFERLCKTARKNPNCKILLFTKKYFIINEYLQDGKRIPKNLIVIFSGWPGRNMDNPHNMPIANVVLKGDKPEKDWKKCTGDCSECAYNKTGCWNLKKGETLYFDEH